MTVTNDSPSEAADAVATLHFAFAEASIFLIESLLLMLHERGVLDKKELLEVVRTALEAKRDLVEHAVHREISAMAAGVLTRIENSLSAAGSPPPTAAPE